eukprot:TRINITY_DN148_c0_g2_i3.p2 TRINITY_DN148_c0_g2~~TRINITY_DN148_c0_g2_i3.p2  ORF type:complete len:146 (-),score=42.72 TRINITY_DN148_c0_g2_i3:154-591(-)
MTNNRSNIFNIPGNSNVTANLMSFHHQWETCGPKMKDQGNNFIFVVPPGLEKYGKEQTVGRNFTKKEKENFEKWVNGSPSGKNKAVFDSLKNLKKEKEILEGKLKQFVITFSKDQVLHPRTETFISEPTIRKDDTVNEEDDEEEC